MKTDLKIKITKAAKEGATAVAPWPRKRRGKITELKAPLLAKQPLPNKKNKQIFYKAAALLYRR